MQNSTIRCIIELGPIAFTVIFKLDKFLTNGFARYILIHIKVVYLIEVIRMNGFRVFKNSDNIEKHENEAGIFRLLVQDDQMEIFESNVNAGKSIICQPYESRDSINIIFVVDGRLFHTNEREYITSGDRITFKNLQETHHLSVIDNTKILMIRNSNHFIKQVSTADEIYNLIHQIQAKDKYTEDHCNNTGNLAVQIATLMKLPSQTIENILYAGKIHDVGKINICENILNKPSELTEEEYDIVKKHPQFGHDIIMKTTGNSTLAKIVLDHHERLDGTGYPNGLKGDEISIEAMVLAVVDSFDAMTSNRPYKKKITTEEALEDLKSHIGSLYDSRIVLVLEEIIGYNTNL